MPNKNKTSLLVLGDLHVGARTFNEDLFQQWLKDAKNYCKHGKRKGKGYIALNGDLCDVARASQDSWSSTMTVPEQIDFIVEALEPFKDHIIGSTVSNHECFDEETELLTNEGWKFIEDCDENTVFATMNKETHSIEYQLPISICKKHYKGKMIEYESRGVSFKTTPNHRFIFKGAAETKWNIGVLKGKTEYDILLAGFNDLLYSDELSDEEVRLIAWCLTDAHRRNKDSGWTFFQSEPNNERIENLLNHFGLKFNKRVHSRIGDINGYNQDGKPIICRKTAFDYYLDKENSLFINDLIESHTQIPESIFKLDKRQFDIFLKEVVFCDGSFDKGSYVVYKSKEFLDQLQILCLKNGYRTNLKEYRPNHWRLYINETDKVRIVGKNIKTVDYDGLIFCATVENDTLVARRHGKTIITGNSRMYREFNMDVGAEIASRLDIPYGIDLFYDIPYNKSGDCKRLFMRHGTRFSKSYLLFMRNFINDMNNIEADIYVIGHSHFGGHQTRVVRTNNGIKKKHYVVNGAFIKYLDSYAQKAGYDLRVSCYPIIQLDDAGEFYCTMRWGEDY